MLLPGSTPGSMSALVSDCNAIGSHCAQTSIGWFPTPAGDAPRCLRFKATRRAAGAALPLHMIDIPGSTLSSAAHNPPTVRACADVPR